MPVLLPMGIAFLSVGTASLIVGIILEIVTKQPHYMILVKVASGLFALGAILFSLGVS